MVTSHAMRGLSPRVRGNPLRDGHFQRPIGSIPARAGEPPECPQWRSGQRVYPRACGGTTNTASSPLTAMGLSPRVRGNHGDHLLALVAGGSIPARAGEPDPARSRGRRDPVYPRACGGTAAITSSPSQTRGLSPRVRGNHGQHVLFDMDLRSIPARAGEPESEHHRQHGGEVYPRACGGTTMPAAVARYSTGLSPRVRGNPSDIRQRLAS